MRQFLRDNGIGLGFGLAFLLSVGGQALAGHQVFNDRQLDNGGDPVGFWSYLVSSDFAVDVAENWQSEYLQFALFVAATVWLVQRGSPESKAPQDLGLESDEKQQVGAHATEDSPKWVKAGGWRTSVFSYSLGITMALLFLGSWLAQSVAGLSAHNAEEIAGFRLPVSWGEYVTGAEFWSRSLQNWQSEFLAIGSMAVLSVYLRHRGSPESKPVGAAHAVSNESG